MNDFVKEQLAAAVTLVSGLPPELRAPAFGPVVTHLLEAGGTRPRSPRTRSRNSARKPAITDTRDAKRASPRRRGPKAHLEDLIDARYFAQARVIGDVIEHLESSFARKYGQGDISPTLVRLVREGKLRRERNAEGQYQYAQP